MFPKAGIKNLVAPTLNHKPILLDTHFENNIKNKPFRLEVMWARDPECEEVVDQAWRKEFIGSYGFNLMKKNILFKLFAEQVEQNLLWSN